MTIRFTVERLPLRLDFEVGSFEEGLAALQEKNTTIRSIIALGDELANEAQGDTAPTGEATTAETTKPKPRGRPKANQPDPATATAPPPVAVPSVAAPPVAPTGDSGIPAFLDRSNPAAVVNQAPAAAAPPPPPPAPPAAPVTPPSGILAGKVIQNLDARKAGSPDGGKSLADWLAQCGLVNPGEPYDAAIAVVRMTTDDKLAAIAGQLGVS